MMKIQKKQKEVSSSSFKDDSINHSKTRKYPYPILTKILKGREKEKRRKGEQVARNIFSFHIQEKNLTHKLGQNVRIINNQMKENKFIATKYDKDREKETLKFDYHGEKGLDQKPPFLSCVFIKKGGV